MYDTYLQEKQTTVFVIGSRSKAAADKQTRRPHAKKMRIKVAFHHHERKTAVNRVFRVGA